MGRAIQDSTTFDILAQLNKRFGPDEIQDMAGLQAEFGIFSEQHTLQDFFTLLGIVPCDRTERDRWLKFLDDLKGYPSDVPNMKGYDRVIKAFMDALGPHFPPVARLPVFVDTHAMAQDARVTVTQRQPLAFSVQTYVVLSIPTKPGPVARQEAAETARKRRAEKPKK